VKPFVYLILLLLLVPLQTSLLAPLARFGIRPDLGLAVLYAIGLLTGPAEGAFAGILLGLMQDVSSAGLIGLTALSRGIMGYLSGLLGQRVLDTRSPSNSIFLAVFSLAESLMIALFFETAYGDVPVVSLLFRRMLPSAVITALAGYFILRYTARRDVLRLIRRRELQQER
jgi:rod shape-determining protein MreD